MLTRRYDSAQLLDTYTRTTQVSPADLFQGTLAADTQTYTLTGIYTVFTWRPATGTYKNFARLHFTYIWEMDAASGELEPANISNREGVYSGSPTYQVNGLIATEPTKKAVQFNGAEKMQFTLVDPNNSSFSGAAWIKPDAVNVAGYRIISNDTGSAGFSLSLGDPGSGRLRFYHRALTPTSLDTDAVITAGQTHFVAFSYNASTGERKIYVDGNVAASDTATGTVTGGTNDIAVGADQNATPSYFSGVIDEVSYVAFSIPTDQDIAELWEVGSGQYADLNATAQSYTLTGVAAQVTRVYGDLDATAQSYTLSGVAADLTYHPYMYLRPDGVVTLGSWTDNADGTTNIYQAIDEVTASDTDYVKSETEPSSSTFEVSLSNPAETVDDTKDHTISYRYAKNDATSTINLTVSLRLGASTEIASWTHNDIGTTVTQADQTLSGAQVTAITGYTDLRLRFVATEV